MKKNFDIKVSVLGAGYWGTVIINTLHKLGYKNINVYDTNNKNLLILKENFQKLLLKKFRKNIKR